MSFRLIQHQIPKAWRCSLNFTNKPITMLKQINYSSNTIKNDGNNKKEFYTMQEYKLAEIMGVTKGYKPIPPARTHLLKYIPKSQDELPVRSMVDSFLVGLIPLSSNPELQDKYITFLGHVRVGRILEDMDIFAVMVAQKHLNNPKLPKGVPSPQTLVTALVDAIEFTDFQPKGDEDIKISGHVSWVGNSTMEIVVWLEQKLHGHWIRITQALFVIAARDPMNQKSVPVNPLSPANEREKKILSGGEDRKKQRIEAQKRALSKVVPNQEEQKLIHDLYLKTRIESDASLKNRVLSSDCIWMENTSVSTIIFSHPENRNLHNTVFGGFIMRQAMELSWVAGFKFSKYRPIVRGIMDINFSKPISVNSLVQLHSHVVFTHKNFIHSIVYVEVFNPINGQNDTTNTFHFIFEVPDTVMEVIPKTYHEAMMYIDGRRHFLEFMKNRYSVQDSPFSLTGEDIVYRSKL